MDNKIIFRESQEFFSLLESRVTHKDFKRQKVMDYTNENGLNDEGGLKMLISASSIQRIPRREMLAT